jgi:Tfp pilus assembly protein PilF
MKASMRFLHFSGVTGQLVLLSLLAACSVLPVNEGGQGTGRGRVAMKAAAPAASSVGEAQQRLRDGIASYENGNYKVAAQQLQSALAQGLEGRDNQVQAHKYLAFIYCGGNRTPQCRDEFRMALVADPGFELSPVEAGHPVWGPLFRKLKAPGEPAHK